MMGHRLVRYQLKFAPMGRSPLQTTPLHIENGKLFFDKP